VGKFVQIDEGCGECDVCVLVGEYEVEEFMCEGEYGFVKVQILVTYLEVCERWRVYEV